MMKSERPVLFWDSGSGGIPYIQAFARCNPQRPLLYLADRAAFPYGEKTREALLATVTPLAEHIIEDFDPCLIVLACNTLTVSALDAFRQRWTQMQWVGTVPAIKPAVLQSKKRHIGVIGTERTIEDPYIAGLVSQYGPDCRVTAIAAPGLVRYVEEGQGLDPRPGAEDRALVAPFVERFREAGADALVLGCTHFLALREAFIAAAPDMAVYDSLEGVVRQAETLLNSTNNSGAVSNKGNLLLLSGSDAPEESWRRQAAEMDFSLKVIG
jgi:glutamate racemase